MDRASAPEVDILLIRHGQAVSNIDATGVYPNGIDPRKNDYDALCKEARQIINGVKADPISYGCFLPDGLTEYGVATAEEFTETVQPMDNVYMFCASGLTRSIQTVQKLMPAFETVEGDDRDIIHCHPGFVEGCNWPHDIPAIKVSHGYQTIAPYIQIKGGHGPDRGDVVGEVSVDLTNTFWHEETGGRDYKTPEGRWDCVRRKPTQEELEERVRLFRIWLRSHAMQFAEEHRRDERPGTARIVLCVHGGITMFLMNHFHPVLIRNPEDDPSPYKWVDSKVGNLGVVVCRFQSATDDEAALHEKQHDPEYSRLLGAHYVELGSEPRYYDPDGSLVDLKAEYMRFNRRAAHEVWNVTEEHEEAAQMYITWTGCSDAA